MPPAKSVAVATDLLRKLIVDGVIPAGQRLKEEELSRLLEVSRTPVRQALLTLAAEGLVTVSPNRGATVSSFSIEDIMEIYELRAKLEGQAARWAAERITSEQLAELRRSLTRIRSYDNVAQFQLAVEENRNFHSLIVEASRSKRINVMLTRVTQVPDTYRSYLWYTPQDRHLSEQFHALILDALTRQEPDRAERLSIEHVLHASDMLVRHFTAAADAVEA